MTFLHLADLHIGKRVNDVSMLDDQRHVLSQIVQTVRERDVTAVLIAGDVYDKPIPPVGAVELFDDFLTALSETAAVVVVAGNHDSAERLAFGAKVMEKNGVHFSRTFDGTPECCVFLDEYGEVSVWLLPFIKPIHAAHAYEEDGITSYTEAVAAAIKRMPLDDNGRHVLVTHQFVTGAITCESEELSVGGTDQVDAAVFAPFDYVALGHLHAPQSVTRDTVRYAGSPLKYSFSEARHKKSMTLVTMKEKGTIDIETIPLVPLRDMVEIEGTYDEVASRAFYDGTALRDSYLHITLTDEDDVPDAIGKLRVIYPHLMKLSYNNRRTREQQIITAAQEVQNKHPLTLFEELYERQNNQPMSEEQRTLMSELIESIWEGAL